MYKPPLLGPNYTQENGKLATHRNKLFMSAVQGYGGLCVVGTADGDLLLFRGSWTFSWNFMEFYFECVILSFIC